LFSETDCTILRNLPLSSIQSTRRSRYHIIKVASRALQSIGLTVQLGLAAFAAYNATRRLLSRPTAMASPGFPQRHLDATAGREVVYCHICENEWYRDDYPHLDLECPRCHNDFVQIVEPGNDPRPNVRQQHQGPRSDSDPDEADIDEFFERGPGSFFMRRSVYPPHSPLQSPFDRPSGSSGEGPDRPRARPDDPGEAVLSRFADMFAELGGTRPGQSGGGHVFGTQPRIQRTTFTRSGDGVASFTFTTTTTTGGAAGEGPEVPPFDTLFQVACRGCRRPRKNHDSTHKPTTTLSLLSRPKHP